MRTHPLAAGTLCLSLLLAAAGSSQAAARHFRASVDHFRDYATKAATLYFKSEVPAERQLLAHLTSISAIYAEKTALMMYLVDVQEHLTGKRDRMVVDQRIQDVKKQHLTGLPQDSKLLADLVEAQENQALRALGNLVVTEMRVYERNLENL